MEVDETRAGEFGARHQRICRQCGDDRLGELARILAGGLRMAHRDVRGVITVSGVAGSLKLDGLAAKRGRKLLFGQCIKGVAKQGLERVFQGDTAGCRADPRVYRKPRCRV